MKPVRDIPPDILAGLYRLFRDRGYEGASIGDISAATGLGRSSLYHYFPGGKEEMASAVIELARTTLEGGVFAALRADSPLDRRVDAMIREVTALYQGGEVPCVLATLNSTAPAGPLAEGAGALIGTWTDLLQSALRQSGLTNGESKRRALGAMTLLQGGLIMSRAMKSPSHFLKALETMKRGLLAPAGAGLI